jgi:hypothetical protein
MSYGRSPLRFRCPQASEGRAIRCIPVASDSATGDATPTSPP